VITDPVAESGKQDRFFYELEQLGMVIEVSGQKRNRLYSYVEYIRIMNESTELPH
jgi:hypothetical protein